MLTRKYLFLETPCTCITQVGGKGTVDFNNGCNDNYDSNDGNFDDNDDKKHTHIISFE